MINQAHLRRLVEMARDEDLAANGDITSELLRTERLSARTEARIVARGAGRFCGREVLPTICELLAPALSIQWPASMADGAVLSPAALVATLYGPLGELLHAERTILNFLQHLCGIATLTARFVAAVGDAPAKVFDTRKTTPGLRDLEKYAVRCGGGHNHRNGLHDAILLKDNHLAGVPDERLAQYVFELLGRLGDLPSAPRFVEVECDRLEQVAALLKVVGIDVILLDNFAVADLRRAVAMQNEAGLRGKVALEASGRVTLENVRAIAETGVERIAVGAITHSAPILDLGLDIE